jgi:acyl-CoA synthetase (AMP-forming)/AMP-acid ligase II
MAQLQPHRPAIVFPEGRDRAGRVSYTHYTFEQLDRESDRLAAGLEQVGVGRGVRTVLMVTPSLELFSLVFALFKVGAVLVMVDPGIGRAGLSQCLAEAEPQAFIGIPKAHVARLLFGWARKTLKTFVTVGSPKLWGGLSLEDVRRAAGASPRAMLADAAEQDVAAVLFTSGSTGSPKGAVYTHGNFLAQVEAIREMYGIEPGEIDLPTFPLFALFDPALGMTAIIPDMDASRPGSVDPKKIVEAIENFGATNMFGSPALLDRVGRYAEKQGIRFPSLRRVISAGAPVSSTIVERFSKLLSPDAQIVTPYGATESLPVATIGSMEILADTRHRTDRGAGVCVGRPAPRMQIEIIRISDEPIEAWSDDLRVPTGVVGEIAVRGPVVTRMYHNRADSTKLAKIREADGSIRHRMGDLGYFDDQGRLWFCGRKSHRVTTPTGVLFTDPCEAVFNVHESVRRTALVGVRRGDSCEPVLCVELEESSKGADRAAVERELLEIGASFDHTRSIRKVLFHDSFPVDVRHNAKIFREKLAVWAAEQLR